MLPRRGATGARRDRLFTRDGVPVLHDGSGKVVVEDKEDHLDSFLELHYPASDIPQQAQALYKRSWLRLIPDTGYTSEPLVPALIKDDGAPLGQRGGQAAH